MYCNGEGVEEDKDKRRTLLEKAATSTAIPNLDIILGVLKLIMAVLMIEQSEALDYCCKLGEGNSIKALKQFDRTY